MDVMMAGLVIGLLIAVIAHLIFKKFITRTKSTGLETKHFISIDDIKSLGELVVFKIVTKEIVTTADHWFGKTGKRYFSWLVSSKKMALKKISFDFRGADLVQSKIDAKPA